MKFVHEGWFFVEPRENCGNQFEAACRFARFFMVKLTKREKIDQITVKYLYQMTTRYTN
jgi:hypothetical protein